MVVKEGKATIFDTADELVHALADHFVDLAKEAIAAHGKFTVALSGGSTPKALYELLAQPEFKDKIDWSHVQFFLGDERCVPKDHPDSNFGMVTKALLSKIEMPIANVFAPEGQDKDASGAAKKYEERMRDALDAHIKPPRFDLILLGLGPDGHTASLFPGSPALGQRDHWFVANYVDKFKSNRLTITFPVINSGANVIFLVTGDSKASIIKDIFQAKTKSYPAQLVNPESGKLEWYMDRAAAANMNEGEKVNG